jgi:hypothetical protein
LDGAAVCHGDEFRDPCEVGMFHKKTSDDWLAMYKLVSILKAGWWFGTFFIFPYIGKNNPN